MNAQRTYLALGDSMSIDPSVESATGRKGGGAVSQFARTLGNGWRVIDRTFDGCRMETVPLDDEAADLVTLTVGGNDLVERQERYLAEGLQPFDDEHRALLEKLRARHPQARIVVANIYAPAYPLAEDLAVALDVANGFIAANVTRVDARLADVHKAFAGKAATHLCQEIEPTLAGATAIAFLFVREAR